MHSRNSRPSSFSVLPQNCPEATTAAFLIVAGFTFWFALGFPFANHNESYFWVALFADSDLIQLATHRLASVTNFRPAGQILAYLSYQLSGGSLVPIQLFNFLLAMAAWLLLGLVVEAPRVFSWMALAVGGFLFSGYIYLFHLHGVFYSPLLLLVAAAFYVSSQGRGMPWLFPLTLFVALFHPYALLVYLSVAAGVLLEGIRRLSLKQQTALLASVALAIGMLFLLVPADRSGVHANVRTMADAFLTTYRSVEVNPAVSFVAVVLVTLTSLAFPVAGRPRVGLALASVAAAGLALLIGLPVVVLWIAVCAARMAMLRRWGLSILLLVTSLLPVPPANGSPTHSISVLMLCAASASTGPIPLTSLFRLPKPQVALVGFLVAAVLVGMLRVGVRVPVFSRICAPIPAEREKTHQLERIVSWWSASEYRVYPLVFTEPPYELLKPRNAIRRTHRPPAGQADLNAYVKRFFPGRATPNAIPSRLLVTFGESGEDTGRAVFSVTSLYAGVATVRFQEGKQPP